MRQVGLLPGDPERPLITGTRGEHPGMLRQIAPGAGGPLIPHHLAPASRLRLQMGDLLHANNPLLQSAVPALLRVHHDESPVGQQIIVAVRNGERTGFTSPAAVQFGSNLARISLPPPAIALANLLRISFRPPSTLLDRKSVV